MDKKGGKKSGENSISLSRLVPRNQTISSTATRKSSSAAMRARLVLRWYIQRCMEGPFETGIISGQAPKGSRSERASGAGVNFLRRNALGSPPCTACNEHACEQATSARLWTFRAPGLYRPAGSNSHANPSLSAAGWPDGSGGRQLGRLDVSPPC